ncbi:TPA: prophage tail fiber N-terminal domain-containing protein, partial [Escherichia coli]
MAVRISGVLKDGTGKPVQNCTIQLKAKRNSATVVVNTVASENPDEAGRYSMDVECGQYGVILWIEGSQPSHAGTITVYEDSQPGTLNDFLLEYTEQDARPEVIVRLEELVSQARECANSAVRCAEEVSEIAESVRGIFDNIRELNATTTQKGLVQLSNATDSESETLAATPKAVKAVYDLVRGQYIAQDATTEQKGIVQLSNATDSESETLAATPKAVKAVMDEANGKAPLNSPKLTGAPTTPTPALDASDTEIANAAFVRALITELIGSLAINRS